MRPWRKGTASGPWREIRARVVRRAVPEGGTDRGMRRRDGEWAEGEVEGWNGVVEKRRRRRQRAHMLKGDGLVRGRILGDLEVGWVSV